MKNFIRNYFTFNKRERNGVFVLLGIIALQVAYLNLSSHFVNEEPFDDPALKEQAAALRSSPAFIRDEEEQPAVSEAKIPETKAAERFDFDPNRLTEKQWKRLGLSEKQIRSIHNYESKGGQFRKKEDLKKMYCIREELYASLEPFIRIIPEKQEEAVFVPKKLSVKVERQLPKIVEINAADSAALTGLKGIGPFFAKQIIKYRNSIGGFHSKEQLLEVWKFDREKLSAIEQFIEVDASGIRTVNINSCEAAELKTPYISWNIANGIVNYRKNHGKYKSVSDIRLTDLVDEETYRKIAPYLIAD